jgi:hypothetical protein
MARGQSPDPDALAGLTGGGGQRRLHKAPPGDPVAAVAAPPPTPGQGSQAGTRELRGSPSVTFDEEEKKTKVGYYALPSATARAKAAFMNMPAHLRPASWTDFIAAAVMEKTQRIEAEHNDGKPWPTAAGQVARGRPVRQ